MRHFLVSAILLVCAARAHADVVSDTATRYSEGSLTGNGNLHAIIAVNVDPTLLATRIAAGWSGTCTVGNQCITIEDDQGGTLGLPPPANYSTPATEAAAEAILGELVANRSASFLLINASAVNATKFQHSLDTSMSAGAVALVPTYAVTTTYLNTFLAQTGAPIFVAPLDFGFSATNDKFFQVGMTTDSGGSEVKYVGHDGGDALSIGRLTFPWATKDSPSFAAARVAGWLDNSAGGVPIGKTAMNGLTVATHFKTIASTAANRGAPTAAP